MAAGRRSGDPKDLLLVDPTQPEATKRARRHLTKRQKEIFVQYGFSKALLTEVVGAGWDQVDINNYVLYYNSQVETTLAVRSPGLDMSMKQTINAIIRTKLQAGQEEREIGLVTPTTQKGPSTGEPLNQIRECYPQDQGKRSVVSPSLAQVRSRGSNLRSQVHNR